MWKNHFAVLVAFSMAVGGIAHAFPNLPPKSMGAVGDSVTAGTLAGFSRDSAESWTAFVKSTNTGGPIHFPALSWATGSDAASGSFLLRLIDFFHILTPPTANFAVPGAEVEAVRTLQLPKLSAWSQANLLQKYPELLTVFIGGNDVCAPNLSQMTEIAAFEASLRGLLEDVLLTSPTTRILLVPTPKGFNSFQKNFAALPIVGSGSTNPGGKDVTCQDFWDLYEKVGTGCPTVLHRGRDAPWIQAVDDRIAAFDEIMSNLTLELATQFHMLDGRARITLAHSAEQIEVRAEELSVDCFHPNALGQAKLAAAVWQDAN